MPIRFFCEHCRQMLKIGTSKVGSVVDCPRCHKSVVVPLNSAPQAEQLYQMLKSKRSEQAEQTAAEEPNAPESALDELGWHIDDADLNRLVDELWAKSEPGQTLGARNGEPNPIAVSIANDITIAALQKRYKSALSLLYVVAAAALFIGIIFGIGIHGCYMRQARVPHLADVPHLAGANEISGTLFFINENGERRADADAVIIFLPMGQGHGLLISPQGLRPGDRLDNDAVQLIQEMGGMHTRADARGHFTLPYREGVRYFVVKISAHQTQPEGAIPPGTLQELSRYFSNPSQFGPHRILTDEFVGGGGRYIWR